MPQKTRQQKIIADARRGEVMTSPAFSFSAGHLPIQNLNHIKDSEDTSLKHIKKDLIQTLVISTLFIGGEIALAFISRRIGW